MTRLLLDDGARHRIAWNPPSGVVSAPLLFPFVNKDVNQAYTAVRNGMTDDLFSARLTWRSMLKDPAPAGIGKYLLLAEIRRALVARALLRA
jgi:hypothetical protein